MERVDYESLVIQDLLNFHNDGSLNINPWYQRRSVWSEPQKAYLLNTIFERKPVPSVYIRHQIDVDFEKSVKEVVDGQQRIRSIISYRGDDFAARHPEHKRKVKFSELTRAQKGAFLTTALSVGYLIGAQDQDVIEIFGRINSISKTLNPQEKRNAQFSGEFKQFSLRQAAERLPFWRATGIFSATDISRMQEVQFISDLVINLIEGLGDFSAGKIDTYYKKYDEDFPQVDDIGGRMDALFAKLAAISSDAFSDTVFKQYQLAFSLMVVVDRLRDRSAVTVARIEQVMRDVDARVATFQDLEIKTAEQTTLLDGFTGGNLHRIKARAVREEVLVAAFA
jgi:uncharacterized protein with ParB-like and HNH nuclease domain